jgi:Cof subfamily protein (haloacid dehalogenase superfamily)
MKKLIFFDFDGTLYDHAAHHIPPSTLDVLTQLREDPDVITVLATGRTKYNLTPFPNVHEYFDGYVLLNGLYTEFQGQIIDQRIVSTEEAHAVLNTLDELQLTYGVFAASSQWINYLDERITQDFDSVDFAIPPVGNIRDVYDVQQLFCFGEQEELRVIQERHPNFRVIAWNVHGADIIPKDASKAVGIRHIQNLISEPHITIAFGDAENDIEMLQMVNIGVAMGNATDAVKAVANLIAKRHDEDGIYHMAKQLQLIK